MSVPASTVLGVRDAAGGRLLIVAAAFLWSLAGVFIKFLDLPPLTIVFYRSFFAAMIFIPFLRGNDWRFDRPILISVISYTAAISAFVSANKLTTAANAIVLQYTAPLFVFLFVRLLFREAISKINLTTLFLGMAGVGIIYGGSAGQPDSAEIGRAHV